MNRNFVHQVGDQPRLYYDAGSTNHPKKRPDMLSCMRYTRWYYLLTPWSRVFLEKLTVNFAASQEISRIYGTRKFLTVPTSDTRWYITDNYFIIFLNCWMSSWNIVCPDFRKLPGLATNNMQHISPACWAFINLGFASSCIIKRWFRGRTDHDQQHCYHQDPTVNQRLLLQLL
jgi:hypothetical protein